MVGHNASNTSNKGHQRKSFNRTILEYGDPLNVLTLENGYCIDEKLTVGLTVRWVMWHFIEKGYLFHIPPDNLPLFWEEMLVALYLSLRKGNTCL